MRGKSSPQFAEAHENGTKRSKSHSRIISNSEEYGIDIKNMSQRVLTCFNDILLKDSLKRSIHNNLLKKHIVEEGEFKLEEAFEDCERLSRYYVDKLEIVLKDALAKNEGMRKYEEIKMEKIRKREAKMRSIMDLCGKIS